MGSFLQLFSLFLLYVQFSLAQSLCRITDELTGQSYNLADLKMTDVNWRVTTSQYIYLLNICAPLVSETVSVGNAILKTCPPGVLACQIDATYTDQTPKSLGNVSSLSISDVGQLKLVFSGGKYCTRVQSYRKTVILFHCNKSIKKGKPTFIAEDESCTYTFEWETSAACPTSTATAAPPAVKDCLAVDKENKVKYDLTALSLTQGNWVVRDAEYEYLLNICGQVNTDVEKCKGHSACQVKPSDPTFAKSLGLVNTPVVENGVLSVKLLDGQMCHDTFPRKTTILFTCREGNSLGRPQFVEETDDCEYTFSWESSAACGEPLFEVCQAKDPITGKLVDLSGLSRKSGDNWRAISVVDNDASIYRLNLCTGLLSDDNPCREGTSICQSAPGQSSGRSLGNYGTLVANNGEIVLRFSDGDTCSAGSTQRVTTDIYFTCDPNAGYGSPRLLSSKNDCQYLFSWRTAEACEKSSATPTSTKMSGGLIFIIVVLVLFSVYFVAGFLYNRYVKKEKGLDQIPHYAFCSTCCSSVIDRFTRPRTGAIQL